MWAQMGGYDSYCALLKMAEGALKKLEEQLQCTICLDTYTDPKQLQCNHVYCQKCLVRLVIRDQQGQLTVTCPICRQVTPVPANGVAGLQAAFHINHLLEIQESFKKIGDIPVTVTWEGAVSSGKDEDPMMKHCLEHKEELRLYCDTCENLICFQCAIKGEKHHSHEYELLEKAFEKYQGEIASSLEPMEKQLRDINKALEELDARHGEISDQQDVIEVNIHDSIRQFHEFLDVRKTELINDLHRITQAKIKHLEVQRDQIETIQSQLSSCLEVMRENLETSHRREMLMMKKSLVTQVKELTTSFQPDMLKPNSEANLKYSPSADVTALCQSYGKIVTFNCIDPSKSGITSKDAKIAIVGKESTVLLDTVDYRGQPCKELVKPIESELVSDIRGEGVVQRIGRSQYVITFVPSIKGRHQLHVRVEGQRIRGSPLLIDAVLPMVPMLSIGNVVTPLGIAIDQHGCIATTEWERHCVSRFKKTGERLRSFGKRGSRNGEFRSSPLAGSFSEQFALVPILPIALPSILAVESSMSVSTSCAAFESLIQTLRVLVRLES